MKNPFEVYTNLNNEKNPRPLDWDESAADTVSFVEGVHDSDRGAPPLKWVWALLIFVFAILAGRIFYLQVVQGKNFRTLSDSNRIRNQPLLAPRGLIEDRSGEILAENSASFNLVAIPFDLPKDGLAAEVHTLAQTFTLNEQDVSDKLKNIDRNSVDPVEIHQDLTQQQSILFQTQASQFLGFSVQQIPIRQYLDGPVFSHVLGYTGLVGPNDLASVNKANYESVDFLGKSGVEASYEKYLHGVNGQNMIEVDATGKLQSVLGENDPVAGATLVLNIDKGLQERLYKDLSTVKSPKAAAVAMNPQNGQVLALVSLPSFDNNLFAQGISQKDYQALLDDKNLPLFDRAVAGTYPPGSTSKLMSATAGLSDGVITPTTVIVDNGVITVPNQFGNGVSYQFHGWKPGGLGPMTVRSAIALSSDIFFYEVAGGSPNGSQPGLGAQRLADFFRKFNLGKVLRIDVPGEKPGLVPDPAWKMKFFNNDPLLGKWYLGDTYHLGIGQGDLLVTPLQVAEWTSVIANGGTGFVPEVGSKVLDNSGKTVWQNKPQVLFSNIASPDIIKVVQEGMRQTVTGGTAKPLNTLPITSAGKTGTSQFDGSDPSRTHAWFTAYAPYENPQIVITVLVEAGGEGNAVAEPVVKDALQWWADNRYKK